MRDVRSKRLIEKIRRERGYLLDFQELLATYDPEFMEKYDALFRGTLKSKHMPEKYKHLI